MKLSYAQLAVVLEDVFQKMMTEHPNASLEEVERYCLTVDTIILSCGWALQEYYEAFVDANWDTDS